MDLPSKSLAETIDMTIRTVTTDAIGRCEAEPDLARVNALAIGEGASAEDARAIAQDRASTLRESISDVSSDQVRTVELEVRDTDDMFDSVTDAPFQATERIHIDCVPEMAESVVVDVTNAGGQVRSVQFQVHEDKRQELQNEAIQSAMKRAREKAEHMATTEDLVVGGVQAMSTTEVSTGFESIVDEALTSGSDMDIHPAPITVSESIEVVFELIEE